jgi:hypothetical protein
MLMGHSGGSVGERHYGAKELQRMRAAVETIVLDLSTARVIALPVMTTGGSDRTPKAEGLTAVFTAGLTAARSKAGGQSPMVSTERDTSLERVKRTRTTHRENKPNHRYRRRGTMPNRLDAATSRRTSRDGSRCRMPNP